MPDDEIAPGLKTVSSEYINQILRERDDALKAREALKQEFASSLPADWSADDLKAKFKELLPTAWGALNDLLLNENTSDSVRAGLVKWVFAIGMGQLSIDDTNDPGAKHLANMLEKLAN